MGFLTKAPKMFSAEDCPLYSSRIVRAEAVSLRRVVMKKAGLPIPLLTHGRGVDRSHRHVHPEDGGLGEDLALLGASASRTGFFDGPGLDGEGEREETALVGTAELLSRLLGIALAEEGGLGQLPGGLLKSRLLLGDRGEKAPALAFVERGGVVDDQTVGDAPDDGALLRGPVGGGVLLVPKGAEILPGVLVPRLVPNLATRGEGAGKEGDEAHLLPIEPGEVRFGDQGRVGDIDQGVADLRREEGQDLLEGLEVRDLVGGVAVLDGPVLPRSYIF